MENNCYFVCSRSILKSCDFHSPNPCSSWCYDRDYLVNMINSNNMFDTMSIHICTDVIPFFTNEILPKIKHTFYLVSGDSDATVPHGHIDLWHGNRYPLKEEYCLEILKHPKLIKWYAQNCILEHKKITQIPIGIDYHTISNDPNKFWRDAGANEGSSPKFQEMILKNIRKEMIPFYKRIPKIFVHMTNNSDRNHDLNQIPQELVTINPNFMPRTKIWKEMVNYSFAFSPWGNGPDCHRHWEILCLGCIPIIKSFGDNKMFEDLPVLIVKEYSDVTQQLLDETMALFKDTNFNYNKLLLRYWVDKFSNPPSI